MAVTSYYTVRFRVIGERGASRQDYLHDALDSVTATSNSSGSILNKYRYKPYGGRLSKTGITADPKFQWIGRLGYRNSDVSFTDKYLRLRHYATKLSLFGTKVPLQQHYRKEPSYAYAMCSPLTVTDPSGLVPYLGLARYLCRNPPYCCCCANHLSISDKRLIKFKDYRGEPGDSFGHDFIVNWAVSYIPAFVTGDCSFEWWEYSPTGVAPRGVKNDWVPQHEEPKAQRQLASWLNRSKICSSSEFGEIFDAPSVLKERLFPKGGRRSLFIQWVIKSAPSCPCASPEIRINQTQVIYFDPNKTRGW